ncbi:MAG TPA: hypothetical protein VFB12_04855, partial [Ktedonobacteraceae bacterium]|nr:hypothetical protein [Ktedonobacteraceae bacterium]
MQTGLSILDPIGQSPYRWNAYRGSYFTMVRSDVVAIVEPDRLGSGLYRSRLYIMAQGKEPTHQWIERSYLPLWQQVALIHEATSMLYHNQLGSKDAPWREKPASDKQLEA